MTGLEVSKVIHVNHFVKEYKIFMQFIETMKNVKIWKNFNFDTIETDFYETNLLPRKKKFNMYEICEEALVELEHDFSRYKPPLLKTHICWCCDAKTSTDKSAFLDFLYLMNYDVDLSIFRKCNLKKKN
jgi:hypothetical protein